MKVVDVEYDSDPEKVEKELAKYRGSFLTFLGEVRKHVPSWGNRLFYRFLVQNPVLTVSNVP